MASFLRSLYKGTRAEACGIVKILLLDTRVEIIVVWFTVVAFENSEKCLDSRIDFKGRANGTA